MMNSFTHSVCWLKVCVVHDTHGDTSLGRVIFLIMHFANPLAAVNFSAVRHLSKTYPQVSLSGI